ncbi:AI-2E family transporter [Saccharopolyspora sp. K220]|uniref:AI-2E family transporter n=1 Tax=Saccharopolyspora soli TaxID=2926618 RepID=UPI001F58DAFA|nr:AI-2E family transporter [Saccharopolyspora soli]MCI2416804.1 AI-2E family transporter [Saccharopolyspora soli]
MACWMLTGIAVAVAIGVFVLLAARPLLIPVVLMAGAATIAEPLVARLARHRVPRALGGTLVCVLVLAVAAAVIGVFVAGIVSQWDSIARVAADGVARAREVLAGTPFGAQVVDQLSGATSDAGPTLAVGFFSTLSAGLAAVIGSVVGVLLALYILVFVLADGPRIHALVAGWIPGPSGFGRAVTERAATIVRRYFNGLTLIAVMNAGVTVIGALVLRVPFVLAIGLLCFVAAYIPYLGAFLSGAFAVLMAFGSGGLETALWMLAVLILANAVLENLVRPFTFGAALRLHPLVVLLATLLGGALAGAVGMMVAAPIAAIAADVVQQARRPIRQTRSSGDVPA